MISSYLTRRVISLLISLLIISIISFLLIYFLPGDPVVAMLGAEATEQQIEAVRIRLGLDRPIYIQYFHWISNILRGDFGRSIITDHTVISSIVRRLPLTVTFTIMSLIISLIIAIPAASFSAFYQNSILDHIIRVVSLLGVSIPSYWSGIMGLIFFGVYLGWVPVAQYVPITENFLAGLWCLTLPAFVSGFYSSAIITRMGRSCLLEVLGQDYIRTARAKGLKERAVFFGHAFKNAMLPIITIIGINIGVTLGGIVVIETVFTLPGLGRLIVLSIYNRDYPVVQGVIIFIALFYCLINLIVDILYAYFDPRITYN